MHYILKDSCNGGFTKAKIYMYVKTYSTAYTCASMHSETLSVSICALSPKSLLGF